MKLKEIRQSKGLTISALSSMSRVPVRTIEDIERRKECRISTARALADALEVTLDELYPSECGSERAEK